MFRNGAKNSILSLFLIFSPIFTFCEGIRELMPDSTISAAYLYFNNNYTLAGIYTDFGLINCPANYRLYIHVKNPGETILFGLNAPDSGHQFNLRKPNGMIVLSGTCPYLNGQSGYIGYYHQAMVGPFPAAGGYTPIIYHVTSIADTGDYYFEISNLAVNDDLILPLWDFQVVSGLHSPALPSDTLNGRVWSQSWQLEAILGYNQVFNGRLFVLSDDGIVTKLKFTNARVGVVTIFCNPTGCFNTGNPVSDRKSWPTNTFSTFPGIAQYKVFLNNPDLTVYPSGVYGTITGLPFLIPDPAFPPCSGIKKVVVEVSKVGNVEATLFFPYGAPATNVALFSPVSAGINYIPWDGKDGLGNPVPDGTSVTVRVIYTNGLTNLPIWDQEQNPDGYQVTLVRPVNPSYQAPPIFWDDSNISGLDCPASINLTGCIPFPSGCHTWSGYDCHDKMINSWWYGNSDTATGISYYSRTPVVPVGHDSARCGPGSVTLHATVPVPETTDWYDTITGGTPLLIGDTTFVTPSIALTTTYYAETRNDSSGCTSAIRTPVIATIHPLPVPTIAGPVSVCDSSQDNLYLTDPFMTNYSWSVSPGGSITSGSGTESIFVTWFLPGIQQVGVNYTDTNGCTAAQPTLLNVFVTPKPDTAGPVSGPQVICAGTDNVLYFIAPIPYATTYTWTVPSGIVVVSGAVTDSILVDFPPGAQSGNFMVYASDSCGDGYPSPPYPVTVYQPPAANAGPDDSVCQEHPFWVTRATAVNYSRLSWTTNGTGNLSGDTTLSPTYIPATGETGPVVLTLIVYGEPSCGNDTSVMTLKILPKPFADAGQDLLTCGRLPVMISSSSASHYSYLFWKSTGTGIFDDPTSLHPVYTPGISDSIRGYVLLELTTWGVTLCPSTLDSMTLRITRTAIVSAGPDGSVCEGRSYRLSGASALNYIYLNWTSNGSGLFSDASELNPVYFPGKRLSRKTAP